MVSSTKRNHGAWCWLAMAMLFAACGGPGSPGDASVRDGGTTGDDVQSEEWIALDGKPATDTSMHDETSTGIDVGTGTGMDAPSTNDGGDARSDGGGIDAGIDPSEAVSLAVDPSMATLRVTDRAVPQRQTFTARARTRDGRDVVVPASWSVDRTDVVTIDAMGTATTTNTSGGDVVVTARFGTLSATASLRVILDFGLPLPGTPPGTETLFPPGAMPTMDPSRTPSFVYPSSETVFPQNVYKVLFQWRGGGNDRFRVNFESDRLRLSLYTTGQHPTCQAAGTGLSCFEPTLEIWRFIAASNPRGTVRVTVDGALSTAPGRFYRSAPITLGFSRGPVPGAIYYWSTTAQGVRRATVSDAAPTNFLTPSEADGRCVACHTLSRRGNRLGADVGGENLWVVEVSPRFPPPRLVTNYMGANIPNAWCTFSYDETRVITARRGVMTLRRTSDGSPINTLPLGTGRFGTQPDWAPDGSLVTFALGTRDRDRGLEGARIAVIESRPGDAWGAVTILVGSGMPGDTNQFPSFSWDSQWIAYTHSTGNGQNDLTSDLWLVRRDGRDPRPLTRANTVVNNTVITTPTIQDNMPTWAPSGVPDDYAWVAFSSTRDYGEVLSASSRLGRHEQLWVAAIDLARAAAGGDPSFPAFRLPFQDLNEDTHRPFWAQDRVRPDPDAGVDGGPDASTDASNDTGPETTDTGTGTMDASGMDAGTDAGMDTACVPLNGDCTSGRCCGTLICWDDGSGRFTCQDIPR